MNQPSTQTIIYLSLAVVAWGLGAVFDKLVLKYIQPTYAFYLRLFTMMILFFIILLTKTNLLISNLKTTPYQAYIYTSLSVFMAMSGVFAYLIAMNSDEASRIVPLSSTYPLITLIISVLFLGESFTYSKLIGTILIIAGIYIISR